MKIVVVGGGTAGWITAAFFLKHLPNYDVTVIDSSRIGIIGAGEGSTGALPLFVKAEPWKNNMVNELDFLRKTKATLKLGIRMENWKGDGTSMYSPFAPSMTINHVHDNLLLHYTKTQGRGDLSSIHSLLLENNQTTFRKVNGRISPGFDNHSYHFDGVEVGKYFKKLCIDNGQKCIDSEIEDAKFDENGYMLSISLKNGEIISGDLFFDCSGFARVLMSKMKNRWISYNEYLPVNSALPFSTSVFSKTVRFETLAKTMDAGWMWKIPLQQRHGCGYVFCDQFQTFDGAKKELEKMLGHEVVPNKEIKFESGRYENFCEKNVVAVGLSSHFLEPLQATSIHITIYSLKFLLQHFLLNKQSIKDELSINKYNSIMGYLVDDSRDFIQLHYTCGRKDTPFWKFVSNELKLTDQVKYLQEISKYRLPNLQDVNNNYGAPGWALWSHMLDMAGLFKPEFIDQQFKDYNSYEDTDNAVKEYKKLYDKVKNEVVSTEEFFKYLKL
jgi:tryptophan halogenase